MLVIQCSTCGKRLQVKPELAGKRAKCPGCGSVIAIPAASGNDRTRPEERPTGDYGLLTDPPPPEPSGGVCPGCNQRLAATAVICTNCGFDTRTGKRQATRKQRGPMISSPLALNIWLLLADMGGFALLLAPLFVFFAANSPEATTESDFGWGFIVLTSAILAVVISIIPAAAHRAFISSSGSRLGWAMIIFTGILPGLVIGSLGDLFAYVLVRPRCSPRMSIPYFWSNLLEDVPRKRRPILVVILWTPFPLFLVMLVAGWWSSGGSPGATRPEAKALVGTWRLTLDYQPDVAIAFALRSDRRGEMALLADADDRTFETAVRDERANPALWTQGTWDLSWRRVAGERRPVVQIEVPRKTQPSKSSPGDYDDHHLVLREDELVEGARTLHVDAFYGSKEPTKLGGPDRSGLLTRHD